MLPSEKTVFIVDDERIIADTLSIIVRKHGFQTRAFYSAVEALAAANESSPDLIISDVVMPEMTGIDLVLKLQEQISPTKWILLSGQAQTSVLLEDARKQGHDLFVLSKPIHPSDLLMHVDAALG